MSVIRSKELEEKIRTLYASGASLTQTAKAIGVSRGTLDALFDEFGIPKRAKQDQSGPKHYAWKGGLIWRAGYAYIYSPGHHRIENRVHDNHVKRADLILEEKLGRQLLPDEIAHHKNEIRSDDRPENLEAKTRGTHTTDHNRDQRDRKILRRNNSTGVVGVSWDRENGKFLAQIYAEGRNITLGRFGTLQEAVSARIEAEKRLWKKS